MITQRKIHLTAALLCFIFAIISYGGNSHHQLLHWDDITYITANPWVTDPSFEHMKELMTSAWLNNWHPLTWLSYIPEYAICGDDANCYKTTNIILHGINSFLVYYLVWLILSFMYHKQEYFSKQVNFQDSYFWSFLASLIAGCLFAVHTQHAESVIWVAERKELLCAFFYILSVISYISFYGFNRGNSYLPFIYFLLALMSKPMAVTLPVVLVLIDIFLNRINKENGKKLLRSLLKSIVIEKSHYFFAALLVTLVTIQVQDIVQITNFSLSERLFVSLYSIWHYLITFFYPLSLSPFYPVELINQVNNVYLMIFFAFLISASIYLLKYKKHLTLIALAYFIITLIPVIGVVKVGEQAFADRYTYLPMVSFYLLISFSIFQLGLMASRTKKITLVIVSFCLIILVSMNTRDYKEVWRSDLSLWSHVSKIYSNQATVIHMNLANSFYEKQLYPDAITQYQKALIINPRLSTAYQNLGLTYNKLNDINKYLSMFEKAAILNPESPWDQIVAGDVFFERKLYEKAKFYYQNSLNIEPSYDYGNYKMGILLLNTGKINESIKSFELVPLESSLNLDAQLFQLQGYLLLSKSKDEISQYKSRLLELQRQHQQNINIKKLLRQIDVIINSNKNNG